MAPESQSVLITGCSPGGIGHALALSFHKQGLQVIATARRKEALESLAAQDIITLVLDVDKTESVEAAKKKVSTILNGKLDYLINNAGRYYAVPSLDIEMDEVRQTFETNVFGVMRTVQAFSPLLIDAKGTIVQIGSVNALIPFVFSPVYNATKAALHAYSDTLRVELAPFGVKVITVVTGGVKSRITRTARALPADSVYLPVNEEYQRRIKYGQEDAMETEKYADSVVHQVLRCRKAKRWIWEGSGANLVRILLALLPIKIFDTLMTKTFKLWKLKRQ